MNNFNINELCNLISNIPTQCSLEEAGIGLKQFGKMLERFNKLSDYEKAQFWIDSFRNPENKEACEAFVMRHPDCNFNAFIPKE